MPNSAIPPLAEELPTAELELELLTVSGGSVVFKTNCAYVINLLGEGLGDMTSGDLLRISRLYHAAVEMLRDKGELDER